MLTTTIQWSGGQLPGELAGWLGPRPKNTLGKHRVNRLPVIQRFLPMGVGHAHVLPQPIEDMKIARASYAASSRCVASVGLVRLP